MIHLKNVSKVYSNGTEALKNISLDIEQGEFVFIVGSSGAGKSTFLKLLIHEETPTFGKIEVNGYNLMKIKRNKVPYLRRTMGIVFQDFRLIDKMNVYDNIAFAMRAIGAPERLIRKRVKSVISVVGHEHELVRAFGGRVIIIDSGERTEDKKISGTDTISQEFTDISDNPVPSDSTQQNNTNNNEEADK